MPITVNHISPRFREYKRTPVENELLTLREEVERLKNMISSQESAPVDDEGENNLSQNEQEE